MPESKIWPTARPEQTIQKSLSGNSPSTKATSKSANKITDNARPATGNSFPRHLQISFSVYKGAETFSTSEIQQQLDIHQDGYILKSTKLTTGLASLANNDQMILSSQGRIGKLGLQPEIFKIEKIIDGAHQSGGVTFNWTTQRIRFSNGNETTLPPEAQDTLSFMYQFSQLPMDREILPLSVANVETLEQFEIEIGRKESIVTPMGKVRAWHLRKLHAQNEAYFEIWLGLEYRLLPVKFRLVNSSGEIVEELAVSSIRIADE